MKTDKVKDKYHAILKENIYIALSGYSTHNETTVSQWLEIKDKMKENKTFISISRRQY